MHSHTLSSSLPPFRYCCIPRRAGRGPPHPVTGPSRPASGSPIAAASSSAPEPNGARRKPGCCRWSSRDPSWLPDTFAGRRRGAEELHRQRGAGHRATVRWLPRPRPQYLPMQSGRGQRAVTSRSPRGTTSSSCIWRRTSRWRTTTWATASPDSWSAAARWPTPSRWLTLRSSSASGHRRRPTWATPKARASHFCNCDPTFCSQLETKWN